MDMKEFFKRKEKNEEVSKPKIEIDFKSIFKNRIVLASVAIGFSVLLVFGGTFAMDKILNSTMSVVRLKLNAPMGTQITDDMIEIINAGKLGLAEDTIVEADIAVGKYTAFDLYKGDNLAKSKLSTEIPLENKYLYALGDNEYAISVGVPTISGSVGGKIRAGDIVTVLATLQDSDGEKGNYLAISPPELKYVKVLAVSGESGKDISIQKDTIAQKDSTIPTEKKETIPSVITFLVNDKQSASLAGLEQKSQIHLALASRAKEQSAKLLLMQQSYFDTLEDKDNG